LLGLITIPIALLLGVFGSADCVAQQLKVIPEQLDFAGCIQAGMDTVARPLQLLNRSLTDSIRIDGVFINNKPTGFRATQKSRTFGAGTSTEIEVKFIPKVPGKYTDRLIIRWSLKGIEQVAVEVNLTGQAQMPWLFPVPSGPGAKQPVLDTVTLGDTTIRPLILRNPSNCFPFPITKLQLDDSNGQFFLANRGVLPRSIPPSGFDTILVGVVPRQTGRLVSNLRVNHPHDDRFEFDVWMDVVVVRSKFIIRPRELDFRDVAIGTTSQEQSIAITVLGADNKRFTSIQVVGDDAKDFHFTAPTLPYRLNRGTADSLTIGVECTPTTIGPRLAEIRLRTEDGDEFRIPLYAIGKDEGFMVRPLFVDAGNAAIGETVILGDTIQISKLRPPPASISQIRIDGPDAAMFAVTGSLPATFNQTTPAHRFTVQFTPTRLGHCGAYANFLLPDNSRIRVELHGDGVGASRSLAWVPSATNFGNVRVDSSRTLRFGLVNRGNTREQITTAAMEGAATGDFTIGQLDLPVTLRPFADTLWSDVRFTPTAVGSRTASLRATAASGTTTAVAIQGTGEIWNLTVTPSEVDFGDVTNGSSVTATNNIILTNTGTATIAITEARIEGDTAEAFTLQGETDVKLTQGQHKQFRSNRCYYPFRGGPDSGTDTGARGSTPRTDSADTCPSRVWPGAGQHHQPADSDRDHQRWGSRRHSTIGGVRKQSRERVCSSAASPESRAIWVCCRYPLDTNHVCPGGGHPIPIRAFAGWVWRDHADTTEWRRNPKRRRGRPDHP